MMIERQSVTLPSHTPGLPFSDAIISRGLVYASGQVGWDPVTREAEPDIAAQTERCLQNLQAVLEAASSSLDRTLRVMVYLRYASDFAGMNAVYQRFFPKEPPARTTIVAELAAPNLLIEIDATALASAQEPTGAES